MNILRLFLDGYDCLLTSAHSAKPERERRENDERRIGGRRGRVFGDWSNEFNSASGEDSVT
jgi:hypothetical protein